MPLRSRQQVIQLSSIEHASGLGQERCDILSQRATAQKGSRAGLPVSFKRSFSAVAILIITLFYPAGTFMAGAEEAPVETPPATSETTATPPANTSPPTQEQTAPPSQPAPQPPQQESQVTPAPAAQPTVAPAPAADPPKVQGPTSPPGPEHDSYTYNSKTGMWENGVYAWDPVTKQTKPLTPQTYSYNPVTNNWNTTQWRYDPPSGAYVPNVVSVETPPLDVSPKFLSGNSAGSDSGHAFDLFYDASISNKIYSNAQSGNATVAHNTTGGNALSGDALALANIFNLLQSSASFAGPDGITTFSSDIDGDVIGDLFIDPSALAVTQPATNVEHGNVALNVDTNGQINNDIALQAQTGNATVEGNTKAGDAKTGNANAVANVVNMMNSAISSGKSFLGMLNIYGSLNGDILLPPGTLDRLLASNAPLAPSTTNLNDKNIENSEILAKFNTNQAINNNVAAAAATGNATVGHNTTAGNATTGDALTNITVLNLTGRQLIGSNSLLVFVNVLGGWVGVIMDAPAGSTSAALGSGITKDACSSCGVDTEINADTNGQINNNIAVSAASGDALVQNNTKAGGATSGNASSSVNLLNILNSSFSFSDWFGILFINVFGTWNGSFGVDTQAGSVAATGHGNGGGNAQSDSTSPGSHAQVFRFVPTGQGKDRLDPVTTSGQDTDSSNRDVQTAASVLGDDTTVPPTEGGSSMTQSDPANWLMPGIGLLIGGSLFGTERLITLRQRRRQA